MLEFNIEICIKTRSDYTLLSSYGDVHSLGVIINYIMRGCRYVMKQINNSIDDVLLN